MGKVKEFVKYGVIYYTTISPDGESYAVILENYTNDTRILVKD